MKNNSSNNLVEVLQLFITVLDASKYSNISIKSLVKYIQKGYIPHIDGDYPIDATQEEIESLSNTIKIPLSELKSEDIKAYILDNINKENYFDADFLTYEQKYGKKGLNELLEDIKIIKDISTYRQTHFSDSIDNMADSIFSKYNLSSTRYYEELNDLKKQLYYRGLFKKQLKLEKKDSFKSLCPLACDFIMDKVFRYNNNEGEVILADIKKEAEIKAKQICFNCPHNPLSNSYQMALDEIKEKYPSQALKICELAGNGLIIPTSSSTINKYIDSLPNSTIYFAQNDYKLWEARYGYKISRNYPSKVNEVACSDHTELEILLKYGETKEGKPILRHPWATIQIDIASGVITGSVLSYRPDNETIGQCYARASAITINNPEIYGTASVLLTDRGRDYRSKYICENHHNFPNRAIFENGLLPVLSTKVMHASPNSPWVKPVERTNLTIQKMLRRYPGFSGGKRKKRLKCQAEKELERLLKENRIMTLEQFSIYWYNNIIPTFNNHSVRGKPSPMEKYRSFPKAETLIPDWSTLSIFLKKKHKAKVNSCKIIYKNRKYTSKLLDDYNDKEVLIYTLDDNYIDSIFVVSGYNYVCEAFLEEKIDFIETNQFKLQKLSSNLIAQKRKIAEGIEVVRFLSDVPNFNHHYIDEDIVYTVGEAVSSKGNPITDGSLLAAKAMHEAKLREIEKYQNEKKRLVSILTNLIKKIKT